MALDFDAFAIGLWFAPFILALVAPLIAAQTGRAAGWILAIVPAGLFINLWSLRDTIAAGKALHYAIDWAPTLGIRLSLVIDGLSLVFALLITGIGAVILIYAGEYLRADARRGRFLAVMCAFIGAMLGLVLSDSLVALFCIWELTAVTSFLLIGHHARPAARRAAFQALTITGLGGLALLAGGILLNLFAGTWDLSALPAFGPALAHSAAYPWAVGFIAVAAFTKSAQIPFHVWLPNAMEAPIPVSAYLHSAAMVQAGVYLLARLSPVLSGTPLWQIVLTTFGGATLLWGALWALARTDLKQILVQTTIASLGLSVLLLGFSGEAAALAVAAYFTAHALYKASLFLIAGILEHGTGTRDLTALGGLRDHLTISFIAAALAAVSMFGLPPFLGWFAKEEMYAAIGPAGLWPVVALAVLVLGNALLGTAALALLIRPFMGTLKPTSEPLHEGHLSLWIGPVLFGLLSLAVLFAIPLYGDDILAPMASAITGHKVEAHLGFTLDPRGLPLWLSVATWAVSIIAYWQLDRIRALLFALERRFIWTFDRGFDQLVFGLVRIAGSWTRAFYNGRLELYLVVLFAALALALLIPLTVAGGWVLPAIRLAALTPYESTAVALAAAGTGIVVLARSRLFAIVALGVQGLALALIFIFFGAPDLGFTQLMIEILSVVILTLVMTRLRLTTADPRPYEDWLRDGALALIVGGGVTAVLLKVLDGELPTRLSDFIEKSSVALAHGRNIVNVILVDFRGLDTLGEIAVVMTAGIAVLALARRQHKREAPAGKPRGKAAV